MTAILRDVYNDEEDEVDLHAPVLSNHDQENIIAVAEHPIHQRRLTEYTISHQCNTHESEKEEAAAAAARQLQSQQAQREEELHKVEMLLGSNSLQS